MVRKTRVTKPITLVSLSLAFLFFFTSIVVAVDQPVKLETKFGTQNATSSAGKQARLDQVKLKVCQKKQAGIKKRSQSLARRANLITNRFDRITTRVKEYYTNKLGSKGVTIENYDQMVADIATKKEAVDVALKKAESTAKDFSCDSDNPKGQIQAFRQDMINVIRALKEYKKSVINFLVAVRTKAKNIKAPTATGSATPSAAP
ncbi:MAG: hypothetical protein A2126_03930 [Candidatus Woykebacteria bacterium GWB1_45_5]|uniref:DUF5667 domain-containing protein n=1 Tax=Candidatus Woykebacteria bacterium GWB1_45_5 TaxID=1802592 RepID=A0A1G1W3N8_9BACT|nr:MAG: hypothetical protein A2126_03930 [Candidatus Woykebacteria bacterium GWB1_45_5]